MREPVSIEHREKQRLLAKYQKEAKRNPTKAEQLVKDALDHLGIRYRFQKGFIRDKTIRMVDFYLTKPGICLEVDGKYHEAQKSYDDYREGRIKSQRKREIRFVRVTNEWVFAQKNLPTELMRLLNTA